MRYSLGIDLGGSSVKAVAVQQDGTTLDTVNVPFDPNEQLDWAGRIRHLVGQFQDRFASPAATIGLSAPGLAAPDGRAIAYLPGRLEGLVGLNWTRYLGADPPIPVLNDAQAALLGEAWLGAARGFQNVILLTLGTGVGGAILADGRLLSGHTGKAGHLGHLCLDIDGPPDICGTPRRGSHHTSLAHHNRTGRGATEDRPNTDPIMSGRSARSVITRQAASADPGGAESDRRRVMYHETMMRSTDSSEPDR